MLAFKDSEIAASERKALRLGCLVGIESGEM
jgi:hypothetical protein